MAENRTGEQFSTTTLNLTHTHPPTLVSRSFKFAWWKCFSFTSRPSTLVFDHIRFTVSMARHRARRWATWRLRCRSVCVDFALFCLFVFGSTTMKCPQCEEVESGREWGTDTVVGRRERWETQVMLLAGGWSCWLVAGAVCWSCLLLLSAVDCVCSIMMLLLWLCGDFDVTSADMNSVNVGHRICWCWFRAVIRVHLALSGVDSVHYRPSWSPTYRQSHEYTHTQLSGWLQREKIQQLTG